MTMNETVIRQLVDLNDRFYQSFGAAFAETRRRLQPGVERILDQSILSGDWLDIGCGSGVLGQRLSNSGMRGSYLGLDFSQPLLEEARKGAQALEMHPGFELDYQFHNLLDTPLSATVGAKRFNGVLAFAALHHVPGNQVRLGILQQVHDLLKPGGVFVHSEWQFQNSPKLMARVQPWPLVGLAEHDVEAGDTLLDWRHAAGGEATEPGLRYVHLFNEAELAQMAEQSGFSIREQFTSDGKSGDLALYQVWQRMD